MNRYGLEFHHFGLAVKSPEAAFRYLDDLGYRAGSTCYDPLQKVNLAMRHHDRMPDVEVIWPGAEPSPIDRMLERSDSMIYHLCYTSEDVERVGGGAGTSGFGSAAPRFGPARAAYSTALRCRSTASPASASSKSLPACLRAGASACRKSGNSETENLWKIQSSLV